MAQKYTGTYDETQYYKQRIHELEQDIRNLRDENVFLTTTYNVLTNAYLRIHGDLNAKSCHGCKFWNQTGYTSGNEMWGKCQVNSKLWFLNPASHQPKLTTKDTFYCREWEEKCEEE